MLLKLDRKGPLYGQLYRALRAEILAGRIAAGARVSATRRLAEELGLSRNVVILAYEQLLAEGYVVGRTGAGTFVASELPEMLTTTSTSAAPVGRTQEFGSARLTAYARRIEEESSTGEFTWEPRRSPLSYDFRYGRPSFSDFPNETWCRIIARRARRASIRDLDYGPVEGLAALRETIAEYLSRARAVRCTPEQVIILNGSQQALDLAARLLVEPGDPVVLEEPHYRAARAVMKAAGAKIDTISVDEHGLRTSELAAMRPCRLIIVTPSHQFPTGAVMPLARRLDLLAWADRARAFIFEDDYDSEFRYSGRPIEALQALDQHGRVLYAGTFSKLMFPALRLGYLVLPENLVEPFRNVKALLDTGSPTLPQLALVDFIREGHFERHLHRVRTRSAARRAALLDAIDRHIGKRGQVSGINAGLHVLLWFPEIPFRSTSDFIIRAQRAGVGVYSVAPFYLTPPRRAGLLLGYASLTEREIAEGIRRLASVLNSYRSSRE